MTYKEVLFFKLGALGDLSYCLPAAEAIQHEWPNARLTWVVGKSGADFLRGHPSIHRLIEVDEKKFFSDNLSVRAREIAYLAFRLRKRFDVALVAHRAKSYSYLLKPFVRGELFQLVRSEKDIIWGVPVVVPPLLTQESLAVQRLVEVAIGRKVPWRWDYSHIEKYPGLPKGFVAIHIGGGRNFKTEFELKKWPRWEELLGLVPGKLDRPVVLVGAPSEKDEADELVEEFGGSSERHGTKNILNLVGKTTVRELVAVIREASLFIGIDSGPLHIADSLGIPCVGLYGPTSTASWGLLGSRSVMISASPECAPCYKDDGHFPDCEFEHACMKNLSVDQVLSAVNQVSIEK